MQVDICWLKSIILPFSYTYSSCNYGFVRSFFFLVSFHLSRLHSHTKKALSVTLHSCCLCIQCTLYIASPRLALAWWARAILCTSTQMLCFMLAHKVVIWIINCSANSQKSSLIFFLLVFIFFFFFLKWNHAYVLFLDTEKNERKKQHNAILQWVNNDDNIYSKQVSFFSLLLLVRWLGAYFKLLILLLLFAVAMFLVFTMHSMHLHVTST